MYEAHWQLSSKPFEDVVDPRFYYPGEAHQGALLKLRYVIENRRHGGLLAGQPGLGKTLLVRLLAEQLDAHFAPRLHLGFPQMPPDQLLAYLAEELTGQPSGSTTPPVQVSVRQIESSLAENARAGRHAVVVIDEAHLLCEGGTLETLRLLLNFQGEHGPALTLLLIGQVSILPVLDRMPALEERLGVKCMLRPLTAEETAAYVQHRMQAAGATREVFLPEALETLHYLSQGNPCRINRLCDLALLVGFAEQRDTIGASQLESICEELVAVPAD